MTLPHTPPSKDRREPAAPPATQSAGEERERDRKERERQTRRAYRERNADRIREYKRQWRQRNAYHIRAYRAAYDSERREEIRAKNREYMREYAPRMAAERVRRQAKLAAKRRYYESHKDQYVEYQRRWRARKRAEDPDGYRAAQNARQRAWREANKDRVNAELRAKRRENPEAHRAASRAYYATHAEQLKAQKRAYYQANRDAILARNRAWKQREKRRKQAGLPPRRIRTTPAAQLRANDAAANEFFTRARTQDEIAAIRRGPAPSPELLQPTPDELVAAFMRDSARARIEHALATDLSYARRGRLAEVRRYLASQKISGRDMREAVENARMDAIAKDINDRLRHRDPPRRTHHLDPAAPHPGLTPHTTMGMNR